MSENRKSKVAIIGSGAAGLSAAWLLAQRYEVTLFEKDDRLGGHAHTATVEEPGRTDSLAIDTGFIVYNELNYPNLTAWFEHLGVATEETSMSFAVSTDNGGFEYKGGKLSELFAQPTNVLKPRFWRMVRDLMRFYKDTDQDALPDSSVSLGDLLKAGGYGDDFIRDHLLPFGAAIWSTSPAAMLDYPAAAFLRFCNNHGLLQIGNRPQWRTVTGGSQRYVAEVEKALAGHTIATSSIVQRVIRSGEQVVVECRCGSSSTFDHVVFATHADQTLALLDDADAMEKQLLSPFAYSQNLAILHTDTSLLPRRRRAWASWNYIDSDGASDQRPSVSYWMNSLQNLDTQTDYIVSLNPGKSPQPDSILRTCVYEHPVFNAATWEAQQQVWNLQGRRNTWFCGAWMGSGFHEDAVQSGLACAEAIGGVRRPWQVPDESGRIFVTAQNGVEAAEKYPNEQVA